MLMHLGSGRDGKRRAGEGESPSSRNGSVSSTAKRRRLRRWIERRHEGKGEGGGEMVGWGAVDGERARDVD
eukprot:1393615-Amorphochlora_amoeboformis.AAC.1